MPGNRNPLRLAAAILGIGPARSLNRLTQLAGLAIIISLGVVGSASSQYVQAAIAAIQLIRSLDADGSNNEWIREEFDALNIKIDKVLENEERLARGLTLLSRQIDQVEQAISAELNAKPYKDLLYQMIVVQNSINDLANTVKNYDSLSGKERIAGFIAARGKLEEIKRAVPEAFAQMGAIDAVYEKLRYTIIARTGNMEAQIIYTIELLDDYISQSVPALDGNKLWYIARYSGIQQGLHRFLMEDRLDSERKELLSEYYSFKMPVDSGVRFCFSNLGGDIDIGNISTKALLTHQVDMEDDENIDDYLQNRYERSHDGSVISQIHGEFDCGTRVEFAPRDGNPREGEVECTNAASNSPPGVTMICWPSRVRDVGVYVERLQLGDAKWATDFADVPSQALVALDYSAGSHLSNYWVIPYAVKTSSTPNIFAREKLTNQNGFRDYLFEKIVSRDDDVPEAWANSCLGNGNEPTCQDEPIPEGQSPVKFATTVADFAALSSEKALEVVDFDAGVAQLRKLKKNVDDEIKQLSAE